MHRRNPQPGVPVRFVGANQREVRYSKGGKVALSVRSRVSADGKTLTTTLEGTNAQGNPVDGTNIYEKQ